MNVCEFVFVGCVCGFVCVYVCVLSHWKEAREERREKGRKSLCRSVLQCFAACCIVLQCVAVSCIVLQEGSQERKILHHVATSSRTRSHWNKADSLQQTEAHCNKLCFSLLQWVRFLLLCCSVFRRSRGQENKPQSEAAVSLRAMVTRCEVKIAFIIAQKEIM